MTYKIEPNSSLEYTKPDGETVEIECDEFTELPGSDVQVSPPSYKDDNEDRSVKYTAETDEGKFVVAVNYSTGINGTEVGEIEVVSSPKALEIDSGPNFVIVQCDDDLEP